MDFLGEFHEIRRARLVSSFRGSQRRNGQPSPPAGNTFIGSTLEADRGQV